jgi:hypothetical protein
LSHIASFHSCDKNERGYSVSKIPCCHQVIEFACFSSLDGGGGGFLPRYRLILL